MQARSDKKVVIIGGGPAGLTAAYELSKANVRAVVLEKEPVVGGLSKTVSRGGNLFDLGGHRFFTKVKAVDDLWREVLRKSDFLRRKRLSRIYYNRKFFDYPLRISNVLAGLGVWNSVLILLSYARARLSPDLPEPTFEKWVSNRFGRRLYRVFFKSYTEKVWGIPCEEITADWAEQRIRGLSLWSAVKEAATRGRAGGGGGGAIKTLTREFNYPRRGPGMMWEAVAGLVEGGSGEIRRGAEVSRVLRDGRRVTAVEVTRDGARELIAGTDFISSMPVRELLEKLDPPPPPAVLAAAGRLGYRDFILVGLSVARENLFADNWLYIHDPRVGVGRIQNFGNWSPDMARPGRTCLGMEYFCFEGDELWSAGDDQLVARATRELQALGLAEPAEVEEGFVVRVPKAYPIQDSSLDEAMREIRAFLAGVENLQLIGRNGMHKYNNQDHSMLTAMLAAENILGGDEDVWGVNVEPVYHEQVQDEARPREGRARDLSLTQPLAPRRVGPADKAAEG